MRAAIYTGSLSLVNNGACRSGAGVGWRAAWRQRAPTPLVRRCAPKVGRAVLHWPGCVPRIGTPWKASHGREASRVGAARGPPGPHLWPLRFSVLGRLRKVISARSCVKARPRCARCCAALTPARSDWLRGVRTANTNCSDQPLNGQEARHASPPPLETQRPWEAQPPLRVAADTALRKMPRKRTAFFVWQTQTPGRSA